MIKWSFVIGGNEFCSECSDEENIRRLNFVRQSPDGLLEIFEKGIHMHVNLKNVDIIARQRVQPVKEETNG